MQMDITQLLMVFTPSLANMLTSRQLSEGIIVQAKVYIITNENDICQLY